MTNGRVVGIFYVLSLLVALVSSAGATRTTDSNVSSYNVASLEEVHCN
jgi:hypothetical protein